MKRTLSQFACALVLIAITPATASADPYSDLQQAEKKFYALKTWHADLTTSGQTISMDFVSPDRIRETLPHNMVIVVIGTNGWMLVAGQDHELPPGMLGSFQARVQTIRTLGLQGNLVRDFTVTYTGTRVLNGTPTRTYHLVKKSDSSYTIDWWIGSSINLPLQSIVHVHGGLITIRYGAFNSPMTIAAP